GAPPTPAKPSPRQKPARHAKQETLSERVAAATEELASGLAEASSAANELRSAMEQIAAGAEEAAGASQEQLAAIKRIIVNLGTARGRAGDTRRQTESGQLA